MYGSMEQLENKFQQEMAKKMSTKSFSGLKVEKDSIKLDVEKGTGLDDFRTKMKSNDEEFKKVEGYMKSRREVEMEDELNRFKEERKKIRFDRKKDEAEYMELLKELELKKERELRAQVEKDQIRRALFDLEKTKLNTLELEKKKELQKLEKDREQLRIQEDNLLKEIQKVEDNTYQLDQMRNEEIEKLSSMKDNMKSKQVENKKINEYLIMERSDKISQLRLKREQLEKERIRIMDNLGKVKTGDLSSLRKNPLSIFTTPAQAMLQDMKDIQTYSVPIIKDKIYQAENRLQSLKVINPNTIFKLILEAARRYSQEGIYPNWRG